MDSTEAQLRFGGSMAYSTNENTFKSSHALPVRNRIGGSGIVGSATSGSAWSRNVTVVTTGEGRPNRDDLAQARREFLSYSLSLMRAHNSEHLDSLPVIDVSSLKHIAYVLDSLIYFVRSWNDRNVSTPGEDIDGIIVHDPEEPDDMSLCSLSNDLNSTNELGEFEEDNSLISVSGNVKGKGKKHVFFKRSNSTLCLGCPAPDPFQVGVDSTLHLLHFKYEFMLLIKLFDCL